MSEQVQELVSQRSELPLAAAKIYSQPAGPWKSVMRHKLLAGSCFFIICALTVCVILFYPRKYHSVTKLLLRDGRENVTLDPTASTAGDTQTVHRTRESEILTAIEMMTSREILQGIVDQLSIETVLSGSLPGGEKTESNWFAGTLGSMKQMISSIDPISDAELALIKLEGNLEISAPSEAGVVTVEYRTKTPEVAQKVTQEWIELFKQHYLKSTRTEGAFDFFAEQEVVLTDELKSVREKLKDKKNEFGIVTVAGQQGIVEQQIQTIELELLAVEAKLHESETRVQSLTSLSKSIEPTRVTQDVTGLPNQARDSMRSRLYDLEVEEKRLSAMYTPDHPFLVAVREQLQRASEAVDDEVDDRKETTRGLNPTRQVVDERLALEQAEVHALSKKAEALETQRDTLLQELADLNRHEQIVSMLDRKIEILEERYRAHSMRFYQARQDQEMAEQQVSSVNVVQQPSLEQRPVTPRKKICALLGLFAALVTSFGLPMWVESYRFDTQRQNNQATLLPRQTKPRLATKMVE